MSNDWTDDAFNALIQVASTMEEFTTDDIWKILDLYPVEPRSMGVVMRRASKLGLIRNTFRVKQSVRAICHNANKTIWESLIYEDTMEVEQEGEETGVTTEHTRGASKC